MIFRATAQWFIPMEGPGELRAQAAAAIDATRFVPARGRNRIGSMVESRPDWCISRQRAWGVPIAVFVHKGTGEVLRDPEVVERIAAAFEEEGADAWWTRDPQSFLGERHRAGDYDKVDDILDVWFESGCTHAFVLEERPELRWPADLYLEGSDQHRGWFQSSLLESCGTRGRAPFDTVLTHGFVVDAEGRKMSKSLGNSMSPSDLMKTHGADILRLWVVSTDYAEDIRIGKEILDGVGDNYRRLRNTLRYILGNIAGFTEAERLPPEQMPELERWVLHRVAEIDALVRECNRSFDFPRLYGAIHNFCATDLSAFYFDVRKDCLYCDPVESNRRRAARTVLDTLFSCLTAWLAPVLVFTAEEAWLIRHPSEDGSVHLRTFPDVPAAWLDKDSGRALGAGAPRAPRRHRGLGGRAAREADRLEPRGRPRRLPRRRRPAGAGRPRLRRARDHERHRAADRGRPRGCVRAARRAGRGGRPGPGRRPQVRPLLARPAGGPARERRALPPLRGRARARRGRMSPRPLRAAGLALAVAVLAADQLTKHLVLRDLVMGQPLEITPFFDLVLVWNQGVSFGLLNGAGGSSPWWLIGLAGAIAALLIAWLWRETRALPQAALWLVLAGALGNVADRLRYGAVVDFLDFHLGGLHWPAFNVADSAIVIGAGLLLIDGLFLRRTTIDGGRGETDARA